MYNMVKMGTDGDRKGKIYSYGTEGDRKENYRCTAMVQLGIGTCQGAPALRSYLS